MDESFEYLEDNNYLVPNYILSENILHNNIADEIYPLFHSEDDDSEVKVENARDNILVTVYKKNKNIKNLE